MARVETSNGGKGRLRVMAKTFIPKKQLSSVQISTYPNYSYTNAKMHYCILAMESGYFFYLQMVYLKGKRYINLSITVKLRLNNT